MARESRESVNIYSLNIHPTAIVHPGAELARGVEIGPYLPGRRERRDRRRHASCSRNVVVNGHTTIGKHNARSIRSR